MLIKKDIGDIALIMQSLIALLNPFTWNFVIITYLTPELVDMLDAPVPFLIGVSTDTWDQICSIKEFPDDIIIFDLGAKYFGNIMSLSVAALAVYGLSI